MHYHCVGGLQPIHEHSVGLVVWVDGRFLKQDQLVL